MFLLLLELFPGSLHSSEFLLQALTRIDRDGLLLLVLLLP
jgi:hypothetical protein